MKHLYPYVGLTGFCVTVVIAAEMLSPGVTWLMLQALGHTIELLIEAFRWVAAFAVVGWLGWRLGRVDGRRDAVQEHAQANGARILAWKSGVN